MNILKSFVYILMMFFYSLIAGISFASEQVEKIEAIVLAPIAVEVVLFCPEGSQHEGELVPEWVTNDEATNFFCNDAEEETEISE